MRNVYCIINGEGKIKEKNGNKIIVEFNHNGKKIAAEYTIDGHLVLPDGSISKKKVLFEQEPKIVVDNSLIDDTGKVIEDKDFVVIAKKGEFVFEGGFFDAVNLSLFTKDGYRNKNPRFKKIDPNVRIFKLEHTVLKELKSELKEEDIKEHIQEYIEIVKEPQTEEKSVKQQEPIEKKAEQSTDTNQGRNKFILEVDGGTVIKVKGRKATKSGNTAVLDSSVEKTVSIEIEKDMGDSSTASALITFVPYTIYNIIKANNERALKDHIQVADACLIIRAGKEAIQKNLSASNLTYSIEDKKLVVNFA